MYSLALRIRRICSTEDKFEARAEELKQKLLYRGYSETVVLTGIQRAREVPRAVALEKVEKEKSSEEGRQHRLIVQYDRNLSPALRTILSYNYEAACSRDSRFKNFFPNVPKPVFKRGKNLKQLICRAKLPKPKPVNTRASDRENKKGVSSCNN